MGDDRENLCRRKTRFSSVKFDRLIRLFGFRLRKLDSHDGLQTFFINTREARRSITGTASLSAYLEMQKRYCNRKSKL